MDKQNRAARKKHHVIYKTTCLITDRYYIGMHSTDNLNDGYLGSGKRLWRSIRKHGKENHVYEILEHLLSREALKLREAELVNHELLEDKQCMNIALGGHGSWECATRLRGHEATIRASSLANDKFKALMKDPDYAERFSKIISASNASPTRKPYTHRGGSLTSFLGKAHTAETKKIIADKSKAVNSGSGNPSYGTVWITNGIVSKRQPKIDKIPIGWRLGRIIKIDSKETVMPSNRA
jgi:hypothetical protein